MKRRILFLASLLCMYGTAHASECIGAGCDIEPTKPVIQEEQVVATECTDCGTEYIDEIVYVSQPMVANIKMLSVKPTDVDGRKPLWDGTDKKYKAKQHAKTVSGFDGAPLWDDSIVSYRDRDFSDWYLEPKPIVWQSDVDAAMGMTQNINIDELYAQNMADAAATRARVEELLAPRKPSGNLWTDDNISISDASIPVIDTTVEIIESDGCPFETDSECEIWRRKPMMRESVSPRSREIRQDKMAAFIKAVSTSQDIAATDAAAAPMLARYKMLMRAANSCCTDGLVHTLRNAGASDGLVYKFLADDANFYGLGARCLMTTDAELDAKYPNTATAAAAADVRNGCLCRGREWFSAMLAPFSAAYTAAPGFKDAKFNYTYTDGLGRDVTVSVNKDVQNVLKQLEMCP